MTSFELSLQMQMQIQLQVTTPLLYILAGGFLTYAGSV